MNLRAGAAAALLVLVACGGGSDAPPALEAQAQAMVTRVSGDMVRVAPMVANIHAAFVALMNPGAPGAQGIVLQPGAGPNAFTFSGNYDGNGDGMAETTMSGSVQFDADPASLDWTVMTGQVQLQVNIPLVGHLYEASLDYEVSRDEIRLSGSGQFTNPLTGLTTSIALAPAAPLVIKPATGAPDAMPNACGYSLAGTVPLQVSGAAGTLRSSWLFDPGSTSVTVQDIAFDGAAGDSASLQATQVDLRCGAGRSIDDWVAVFDQQWSCLPRESGTARITIQATGPDTLSIVDEDPPGSGDTNSFNATIVGANPHAVSGFFIGGPAGNQYREEFTWTRRKDGGFSQFSRYRYIEGPLQDKGGICAATAVRVP